MLLFVYLNIMVLFIGIRRFLLVLISFEILSWLFVILIKSGHIKYLIIQTVFILVSLTQLVLQTRGLLLLSLLFKMGLPPFHAWIVLLVRNLTAVGLLFMITVHKLLPLVILSKIISGRFFMVLMLIITRYLVMIQRGMLIVLVFSSMNHSFLMLLSSMVRLWLFVIYWVVYSILSTALFTTLNIEYNQQFNKPTLSIFALLVLRGTPPFTLFWLKTRLIAFMVTYLWALPWAILARALIPFLSYLRVWFRMRSIKRTKEGSYFFPTVRAVRTYPIVIY
jgi:hypothetical protein